MKLNTEERQKQIIETSLNIIMNGGIQRLTIKTIASEIGISEQAIYRHFDNKLHILISIIQYFNDGLENVLDHQKDPKPPIEQIMNMTAAHLHYFTENPAVATVIFSEEIFRNEPTLSEAVKEALNDRIENLTKIITKAQLLGEIGNNQSAENLAHILLGSMRLLITRWRLDNFSFDLEEKGRQIVNDLLSLIKK